MVAEKICILTNQKYRTRQEKEKMRRVIETLENDLRQILGK